MRNIPDNVSHKKLQGFTIVELAVVTAIVGIIATIVTVSYVGITGRAVDASLKSDLSNSYSQLTYYNMDHGSFPTALDSDNCPTAPVSDNNYCLKASSNNEYAYTSNGRTMSLTVENSNGSAFYITEEGAPRIGFAPPL